MTRFLIVNDDGAASPMLAPLAAALAPLGEVTVVVPAEEQSWKGKAMTRFGSIVAVPSTAFGVPGHVVGGTPSDCVNLAVHHLMPERPDWVVSGINIGANAGAAYVIHSGTVAAALEGMLQGIPSVAFSTYLPPSLFKEWSTDLRLTHPDALAVVASTTARAGAMMERLIQQGHPDPESVVNVNFPGAVTAETPVRWVPLHGQRYGALFRPDGEGGYIHAGSLQRPPEEEPMTDRGVILSGGISATLISLAGLHAEPPPESRRPF